MKLISLRSDKFFSVWRIIIPLMMYMFIHVDGYSQQPNILTGFPSNAPSAPRNLQEGVQQQRQQIEQQNRRMLQQIGHPTPPTQAEIIANTQRKSTPVFQTPQQIQFRQEIEALLKESRSNHLYTTQQNYYESSTYLTDLPNYLKARDMIREMLEGKRELSVKDAFYFMEAAYTQLHLNYDEYNQIIRANADFIRQWLAENKYSLQNPEALHYGIQKFMSDTLYITVNGKKQGHIPYYSTI